MGNFFPHCTPVCGIRLLHLCKNMKHISWHLWRIKSDFHRSCSSAFWFLLVSALWHMRSWFYSENQILWHLRPFCCGANMQNWFSSLIYQSQILLFQLKNSLFVFSFQVSHIAYVKLIHMGLLLLLLLFLSIPISWTAAILIHWGHRWSLCTYVCVRVSYCPHQLFNGLDTHEHIRSSPCYTNNPQTSPGSLRLQLLHTSTCTLTSVLQGKASPSSLHCVWKCQSSQQVWRDLVLSIKNPLNSISVWSLDGGWCSADVSVYEDESHRLVWSAADRGLCQCTCW